jgi:stage V sporulation protein B
MAIKGDIRKAEREAMDIAKRLRRRDFSGNTGQAIKNSTWQILTTLVAKIGSLFFTIIVARLLMPELYGLYGLALSTILFLGAFSDLGIGTTISTFLSKTIDKRTGKAKAYLFYLAKFKFMLILMSSLIILSMAYFLANVYYQKPVFYAILAGGIYFPLVHLSSFLGLVFLAKNNFKVNFIGEITLQISRLVIVPLLIVYLLSLSLSYNVLLFWIFVGLSLCFFISGLFYFTYYLFNNPFKKIKTEPLSPVEKREVWKFALPLTATAFSGIFFGFIDTIMLGHYVASEFIGYYQAAFNLIAAASTIISFSSIAMLPIFSRLKGKELSRGFRKTRGVVLLISILALIFTLIVAPYVVTIVYGEAYVMATFYLRFFSLLLISFPLIGLYQAYFTSQKRTKLISVLLIISTVINVILNYVFINIGLSYGMKEAVLGACFATIIARYSFLVGLVLCKKFRG